MLLTSQIRKLVIITEGDSIIVHVSTFSFIRLSPAYFLRRGLRRFFII